MKADSPDQQPKPLVSIIIPFFNRARFLAEAIESVAAQTEKNWELLLINDGSTDDSVRIAERFASEFPGKIRLFSHRDGRNRGAGAARNLGIAAAKGKYLTFLDSDDVYLPDALEKELKAFGENPTADAVCGTLECWYSWSPEAAKRERDFIIDLVLPTEKMYSPPALLIHNLIAGGRKPGINCVMLETDFVRRVGLFENEFRRTGEDQVFWAKVCLHGKIYVLDAVLAKYRQHTDSTCAAETRTGRDVPLMNDFLDWLEKYLKDSEINDEAVWNALKKFRRTIRIETKLLAFKQFYRRSLPLRLRYKIRDRLTKIKRFLARSAHRHK